MISEFSPYLEIQNPQIEISPDNAMCLDHSREFLRIRSGAPDLFRAEGINQLFRSGPVLDKRAILLRSPQFRLVFQFSSDLP